MRPDAFDQVVLESVEGELPVRLRQSTQRGPELIRLGVLSLLAAAIVGPQLWLAAYALSHEETRDVILSRPLMTAELCVAMLFWIGMFVWPLRRLYARVNGRRSVEITRMLVAVRDEKLRKNELWMAPLASYIGLKHRVRSSLSGTRHELVLEHPEESRSILLVAAEHIGESEIARYAALLGLPQIQASGRADSKISRPAPASRTVLAKAA